MAIEGQTHIEEHGGGDANVLIAGQDVDQESKDSGGEHQPGNPAESSPIAAEEGGVDEKFRDVGLDESESGREEADGEDEDQAGGVGAEEDFQAGVVAPGCGAVGGWGRHLCRIEPFCVTSGSGGTRFDSSVISEINR
jgi:hypothetical protein